MAKQKALSFYTKYSDEQRYELCQECSRHGITPPHEGNYIMDTLFDTLKALIETMDRVKELSEKMQQ